MPLRLCLLIHELISKEKTFTNYLRAFAIWLLLMGAEVIHGTLRTMFLVPAIGDFKARQISVFTGSMVILTIAFFSIRWIRAKNSNHFLAIGFLWLFLTLTFEICLGRYIFGYSWQKIGEDYNLLQGGLLPLGLLILTLSPLIATRLHSLFLKNRGTNRPV